MPPRAQGTVVSFEEDTIVVKFASGEFLFPPSMLYRRRDKPVNLDWATLPIGRLGILISVWTARVSISVQPAKGGEKSSQAGGAQASRNC